MTRSEAIRWIRSFKKHPCADKSFKDKCDEVVRLLLNKPDEKKGEYFLPVRFLKEMKKTKKLKHNWLLS